MFVSVGLMFLIISFFFLLSGMMSKMNSLVYLLDYNLLNWGGIDLSYESLFDWVSSIFIGVVFLISGSVIIYSKDYSGEDKTSNRFILLMILFVASMLFMVMSGGLLSMMLGWDGLGVVSYVLVIYYQSSGSYKSGIITIMTNRLGDVLIIISIGILMALGVWSFMMINELSKISLLLVIAACTKSAQIPFSAWLPEAMAAPTPVSSLVHSSTLVTAGVFMLIRLETMLEKGFLSMSALMFMSLMTMIMAGSSALLEMDGKKIVASSTLSQLGLMMFMLSNGLWKLTYFHMIMHAFFKALMFMCVGSILWSESGNQDIRFMSYKFCNSWVANQGLLVSILCLLGFPFLCGFFSKDLMLEIYIMTEGGMIEKIMFLMGFGFSVFYGMRLFLKLMVNMGEEKIYSSFLEGKYINIGIFILMMFSLSSGSIFSWLEDSYTEIMISFMESLIGIMVMLIGILLVSMWNYVFKSMWGMKSKESFFYMKNSWNLSILTGCLSNKLFKNMGDLSMMDNTWLEEMGGGGFYLWSNSFIKFYNSKLADFFLLILIMLSGLIMFI